MQTLSLARALLGVLHGAKAFGGPARASIDLVSRCNIRCLHCIYYSPEIEVPNFNIVRKARLDGRKLNGRDLDRRRTRADADSARILDCLDQLLSVGTRRYMFSGAGEPFMHKDIKRFVAKVKHAGSYCAVNTNGTLLNRNLVDELIELKLDNLLVATMSGSANTYVATHPGATEKSFEIVKENLNYIADRKRTLGIDRPRVTLVFVVIKQNMDGILDFAKFADHVKAERVEYRPISIGVDPGLRKLAIDQHPQFVLVNDQLGHAKRSLEANSIKHNIEEFRMVFSGFRDTSMIYDRVPCYVGWLNVFVSSKGDIYTCNSCIPKGNIFKQSFRDIWNGKAYQEFREDAISINKRKTPIQGCECHSCFDYHANLILYRKLHPVKGIRVQREMRRLRTLS